jgi:SnoaL-like polyketide cyclase
MTIRNVREAAKAVVRRSTEEVQGGGNLEMFDELFADDFLDHTPQPGRTPVKNGARQLYKILRTAFPDFHADIHWRLADGDRVRRTRPIVGLTGENSWELLQRVAKFNSRPSTSCARATARSPSTGAGRISFLSCSNSAPAPSSRITLRGTERRLYRPLTQLSR